MCQILAWNGDVASIEAMLIHSEHRQKDLGESNAELPANRQIVMDGHSLSEVPAPLNGSHKAHGCPSCGCSDKQHLQASYRASLDVPPSPPSKHDAGLHVAKGEQGDAHHTDTPPESGLYLVPRHDEIRYQRNEPTEKVGDRQGDGGLVCATHCWERLFVVEVHQEVLETLWRGLKVLDKRYNGRWGQVVGMEYVINEG